MPKKGRIYSIIEKLDGVKNEIDEQEAVILEERLYRLLRKYVPRKLFRFSRIDAEKKSIENFENGTIYLNNPERYNDPADCMAYVNPDKLMQFLSDNTTDNDYIVGKDTIIITDKFIDSMGATDFGIDTISRIRKNVRVACFTESVLSPLMWSHYAYNHTGFALRYKTKSIKECDLSSCNYSDYCFGRGHLFFPVYYKRKRSDVSLYAYSCANNYLRNDEWNDKQIPMLPLIQKGIDWKYEKEWRYICRNPEEEFLQFEPDALYIGSQTNASDEKQLIDIAKAKGIRIYKMDIDYYRSDFKMKAEEINGDESELNAESGYYSVENLKKLSSKNEYVEL